MTARRLSAIMVQQRWKFGPFLHKSGNTLTYKVWIGNNGVENTDDH